MTQWDFASGYDQFAFGLWSRAVEQDKMTYLMEAVLEIVIGYKLSVLSQVELSCYMCLLYYFIDVRCGMRMYGVCTGCFTVVHHIQYIYIYNICIYYIYIIIL